jgi:hypothetical protein
MECKRTRGLAIHPVGHRNAPQANNRATGSMERRFPTRTYQVRHYFHPLLTSSDRNPQGAIAASPPTADETTCIVSSNSRERCRPFCVTTSGQRATAVTAAQARCLVRKFADRGIGAQWKSPNSTSSFKQPCSIRSYWQATPTALISLERASDPHRNRGLSPPKSSYTRFGSPTNYHPTSH